MADKPDDVKDTTVSEPVEPQEPTTSEPSTEENKAPETDNFLEGLDPNAKKSKSETEDKESPQEEKEPEDDKPVGETEDKPKDEDDEPKAPKSVNRFQALANENKALREQIEKTNSQVYQPQSVEDLVAEGESEAMAEVKALRQEREIERFNQQVTEAQTAIGQESQQIITEFPMFNPDSPDFKPEIASQAAELFEANLIRDPNTAQVDQNGYPIPGTGQIIGYHASPYQIYKPIADAYSASAQENQIKGQQANERMLAAVDAPTSAAPKESKEDPFLAGLLGKTT